MFLLNQTLYTFRIGHDVPICLPRIYFFILKFNKFQTSEKSFYRKYCIGGVNIQGNDIIWYKKPSHPLNMSENDCEPLLIHSFSSNHCHVILFMIIHSYYLFSFNFDIDFLACFCFNVSSRKTTLLIAYPFPHWIINIREVLILDRLHFWDLPKNPTPCMTFRPLIKPRNKVSPSWQ